MNFITLHRTWLLTLLLAYLISYLWLGDLFVYVSLVIRLAPLGLTTLFYPPHHGSPLRSQLGPVEIGIHIVFWTLFSVGTFGSKKLPLQLVTGIYVAVIVLLMLTMGGCALHYGVGKDTLT